MNDLIGQYTTLVHFLGAAFGEHCEIALLDLRKGMQKITAIANGNISGRDVGAPITDLALDIVTEGSWKTEDYITNYTGRTQDGRELRSSTFFIKDSGKLLGMLCINVDTSHYRALSAAILKLGGMTPGDRQPAATSVETFSKDVSAVINDKLVKLLGSPMVSADHMTHNEKIELVRRLEEGGIFKIKGAVSALAQKLQCSQPTIYRYLSEISKSANLFPQQE